MLSYSDLCIERGRFLDIEHMEEASKSARTVQAGSVPNPTPICGVPRGGQFQNIASSKMPPVGGLHA